MESAADAALMDRGEAPGQQGPLEYSPPPPPDRSSAQADNVDQEEEATSIANADRVTTDRAMAAGGLALAIFNAQERYASAPEPTPNHALETAKALLRETALPDWRFSPLPSLGPGGPRATFRSPFNIPFPQDLLGPGANDLGRQAARSTAAPRFKNLGLAYIWGIGVGYVDAFSAMAEGLAQSAVDPIGTAFRQAADIMQQIDERIAQGDGPWEAANEVLNPLMRFYRGAAAANALAGEALEIAPRDWNEAVRRSIEAGRAAASASLDATEVYGIWRAGFGRLRSALRRPRASGFSPPVPTQRMPPAPTPPIRPTRQIGERTRVLTEVDPIPVRRTEVDGVTGKVYRNGVQRLPARPHFYPHPANSRIPVFDPNYVQTRRELEKGNVDAARRRAAPQPSSGRYSPRPEIMNELERRSALDAALSRPDYGYLTQVELESVTLGSTNLLTIPVEDINSEFRGPRGRRTDFLQMAPNGDFVLVENKFNRTILRGYGRDPGAWPVRPPGGGPNAGPLTGQIGGQLRRETSVFDFALRENGLVNVRGVALDGRIVRTSLDPRRYRGMAPTGYENVPGQ